eukprot:TRINITY_DN69425_c0_g1_i3.p1 TRINITY_DN69425_c0_g1~~TRINITY_DN69425_c0_g1_i3.p1  ORF type:complete len:468 (+),score=45.01 TRINITY_DN69425_c0_g1_i3:209-1405(+)
MLQINFNSSDPCFFWLREWLGAQEISSNSKTLTAHCQKDSTNSNTSRKLVFAPAPGLHSFFYEGRRIWVFREVEKPTGYNREWETLSLSMIGTNTKILKKITKEARDYTVNRHHGKTVIYVPDQFLETWLEFSVKPVRSLESVVLPADQSTKIINDVKEFRASKAWYDERGIPYRRGWLFHGPPGCGKSSFIMALAGNLGLGICSLSLSHAELTDSKLFELFRVLPEKTLLLLEDVDAAFVERAAGLDKANKLSFTGLLNALDGVMAKAGLMIFITTNHIEKLDPALIRPGRIDQHILFPLAGADQIERLFCKFYPEAVHLAPKFVESLPVDTLSMAKLQGHFLKCKASAEIALDSVGELLAGKKEKKVETEKEIPSETCDLPKSSREASPPRTIRLR